MTILSLIIAPDPLLKTPSEVVKTVDDKVRRLTDDMLDTMYANNGIGLAAVQVGILLRVIVIDVNWRQGEESTYSPLRLINPEIISSSDECSLYNEGCLSFPEQYSEVERPATVKVRYTDVEGKEHIEEMSGILATCVQHEIDHINGITFVDHISRLKREMILKKLIKAKKSGDITLPQPASDS